MPEHTSLYMLSVLSAAAHDPDKEMNGRLRNQALLTVSEPAEQWLACNSLKSRLFMGSIWHS